MAKKAKKDNKNMIIGGVCAAVVVIVVIIVAVVLINNNKLNDGYFVSDGTKYVLTIESDTTGQESENAYEPVKTHIVYTYSGDEVTGMKTYGEYANADSAKKAFDAIKDAGENMDNYGIEGKYIIVTATPDQYEGVKASDVKAQIDFMESLKNMSAEELNALSSGEESTEAETTENK